MRYLPCVEGQKRPSVAAWKEVEYTGPIGKERLLICGDQYNHVEALDFDDHGSAWEEYWNQVPDELKAKTYVERTPSGGMHLVYRCMDISSNTKLAMDEAGKCLIETRGIGGLLKVAPSKGYQYISGPALEDLELITPEERQALVNIAVMMNRRVDKPQRTSTKQTVPRPTRTVVTGADETPVDFVRRNGVDLVVSELVKNGWSVICEKGNKVYLSHPQASDPSDVHLTVDRDGGWVHNFSANKSEPFDSDMTYSAYDALALLMFGGDQAQLGRYIRETYMDTGAGSGAGTVVDNGADIEVDFTEMSGGIDYKVEIPDVEYPTLEISRSEIPFILQEYLDEVLATSKQPQLPFALYSGLVACAYTVSRRLRMNWGERWAAVQVPVYALSLGASAKGKNKPLSSCKTMAGSNQKLLPGIMTSPRSEQVITETVCEVKKVLLLFDEVGDALFSDRASSFNIGLKRSLKELYSVDGDYTPPRSLASNTRMKNKLGTDCPIISHPSCHVYATGIPTVVYKMMSDADLGEGLAGRFLICLEDRSSEEENNIANLRPFILPESVAHWCDMWGALAGCSDFGITDALNQMGETKFADYEPMNITEENTALVYFDEGVLELLEDVGNEYSALAKDDLPVSTARRRGQHNVQILATVLACAEGDTYDRIPIKVKHVALAKKLVDYSIDCLNYLLFNKTAYDDSSSATREDNSIYGRSRAFLDSWKKTYFDVKEYNAYVKVHGPASRRALSALLDEGLIAKTGMPHLYKIVPFDKADK